jgi:uncharacterized membrane protein
LVQSPDETVGSCYCSCCVGSAKKNRDKAKRKRLKEAKGIEDAVAEHGTAAAVGIAVVVVVVVVAAVVSQNQRDLRNLLPSRRHAHHRPLTCSLYGNWYHLKCQIIDQKNLIIQYIVGLLISFQRSLREMWQRLGHERNDV